MKTLIQFLGIICFSLFISCSDNETQFGPSIPVEVTDSIPISVRYLALGDSYTIGQSVCETCRFPEQLKQQLETNLDTVVSLKIIAQTGWTTSNLKSTIANENPSNDYDLVTLLIGVNNQYQRRPFELYEQEFPELLTKAIQLAKGDKNNVIVVSIPDYAFTPFGQNSSNPELITEEIDEYNAFAKSHTESNGIVFINITDITRQGIENPSLVASDALHPSQVAYSKFVERILPQAIMALQE